MGSTQTERPTVLRVPKAALSALTLTVLPVLTATRVMVCLRGLVSNARSTSTQVEATLLVPHVAQESTQQSVQATVLRAPHIAPHVPTTLRVTPA